MDEQIPAFDLYLELEVHDRASPETIEAAYRSLAKRYHPDTSTSQASDHRMARLNVARDWLADPERRARYDATRTPTRPSRIAEDGLAADHHADAVLDGADRLFPDAAAVIEEYDRVSASTLERRLHIGYARAARLIDQLEARGFLTAFDGSNARLVRSRTPTSPDSNEDPPSAPNAPAAWSATRPGGSQVPKSGCVAVAFLLLPVLAEVVRMSAGLGRRAPRS